MTSLSNFSYRTSALGRITPPFYIPLIIMSGRVEFLSHATIPSRHYFYFETLFSYQGNIVYYSVYYIPSSDVFNGKKRKKKIHIFNNPR